MCESGGFLNEGGFDQEGVGLRELFASPRDLEQGFQVTGGFLDGDRWGFAEGFEGGREREGEEEVMGFSEWSAKKGNM